MRKRDSTRDGSGPHSRSVKKTLGDLILRMSHEGAQSQGRGAGDGIKIDGSIGLENFKCRDDLYEGIGG